MIINQTLGGKKPSGSIPITDNGTYDVEDYASAEVNVPKGVTPSGTIQVRPYAYGSSTDYACGVIYDRNNQHIKPNTSGRNGSVCWGYTNLYSPNDFSNQVSIDISSYSTLIIQGGYFCFTGETPITYSLDGKTKPIQDFKEGDTIVAYDRESDKKVLKVISQCVSRQIDHINHVEFSDGSILNVSDGHPMLSKDGWKAVHVEKVQADLSDETFSELEVGDRFETFDKSEIEVISIKREEDISIATYNFEIEDLHNYFANQVCVHNIS